MANIDYTTDLLKHYVRRDGWLPASRAQLGTISGTRRRQIRKLPLRYFTFCASDAIDVFMLENEGLLTRDEHTGRLDGVFFCEHKEKDFGIIADLIGSPEQGFLGKFEDIVLFEEDEDTGDRTLLDEDLAYSLEVRRKLRVKDAHIRLKNSFPFDIINLDVYGVMFPPKQGVVAPLLKAIIKILEWQTEAKLEIRKPTPIQSFTFFLTSHLDPELTNSEAIKQLKYCLKQNIDSVAGFREIFMESHNFNDVDSFAEEAFQDFFCIAFPKYIVQKALVDFGWKVTFQRNYLYARPDNYQEDKFYYMMHSVAVYERLPPLDDNNQLDIFPHIEYADAVKQIVENGIQRVDKIIENEDIQDLVSVQLVEIKSA
jgi:hypothetical protein